MYMVICAVCMTAGATAARGRVLQEHGIHARLPTLHALLQAVATLHAARRAPTSLACISSAV